jgi:hypothetical protein
MSFFDLHHVGIMPFSGATASNHTIKRPLPPKKVAPAMRRNFATVREMIPLHHAKQL